MSNPTPKPAHRRRWRWKRGLLIAATLAAVAVAGLPRLLSTDWGRSRIEGGINRALAPGRITFDAIRLAWFAPTRIDRFALLDPEGKAVASGPSAVLDRGLARLLWGGGGTTTLTLDGAALAVERRPDGSIDLVRALLTVIDEPDPGRDLIVKIDRGSLRYRDPALAGPVMADSVDLSLRISPSPHPVTWALKLAQGDSGLEVRGEFDRWLSKGGPPGSPELRVEVQSRHWPVDARIAGLDAASRLDGTLDFNRKRGRWNLSGDLKGDGFRLQGPALRGDVLRLDRLEAAWELAEGESGWAVRRLGVISDVGEIKAEGQIVGPSGAGRQRVEGRVDLASIARRLPHALRLRDGLTVDRGSARLEIVAATEAGRSTYDVEARLDDLAARHRGKVVALRDPATVSARLVRHSGESSVERFAIKSSFLDASASGRLDEGVQLGASIDLAGLARQVGDWVDLGGLDLAGRVDLSGTYRAEGAIYHHSWEAGARDLRVSGLGTGPIRRDSATLRANGIGRADPSGFPSDWQRVGLDVRSGEWGGKLTLDSLAESINVKLSASGPMPSGAGRSVALRLDGAWGREKRVALIAEIGLDLTSEGRSSPILSAQGRLDLASGTLRLDPLADGPPPTIPLGPDGLTASGIGRGLAALRVDADLAGDLATVDRLAAGWSGRAPIGLAGPWSAIASARGDGEGVQLSAKLGIPRDSGKPAGPDRPPSMAIRAHYRPDSDRLDVAEFTVATPYGTLDASGRLDRVGEARRVDLSGTLAPDFAALTSVLARRVEPGARVDGKPRPFRVVGTVGGEGGWASGLDADLGFDLLGLDVYGMRFGPSPVVLHARRGRLAVDPIATTLNNGHVRIEPEVVLDAPGGPTLRLAKNSTIRDAEINDEVSRRVLAYVAPILDQATRASGRVTVDLDHAEFPLTPGRGRQAVVEGAVVFEEVAFGPGPLAADLLAAIGRRDLALRLDQPVTLTIADGRVNQRGMAIPIGDVARIELAGWVDFDRNLALTATLPVTPAMLGGNALLTDIAAGTFVRVPISGTLDRPRVDRDALAVNLRDAGKSLLTRGAARGALELLKQFNRPRDPNAPPPPPRPNAAERKARRLEKKAQNRELP